MKLFRWFLASAFVVATITYAYANLTSVGVTNGVPTSGTGTVSTLDALMADGGQATIGAKADAAWSSGDGTVIALLKNIANGVAGAIAAGTNYVGQVGSAAFSSGGWTPKWFIAANSDNATNLKASAGIVHAVQVFGIGSAPAYLKFYDKATAPTCGSDTIVKQIMIPAASTAANGAGAVAIELNAQFSTGISYCVVTGITAADDTSTAASTFVINIDWK